VGDILIPPLQCPQSYALALTAEIAISLSMVFNNLVKRFLQRLVKTMRNGINRGHHLKSLHLL